MMFESRGLDFEQLACGSKDSRSSEEVEKSLPLNMSRRVGDRARLYTANDPDELGANWNAARVWRPQPPKPGSKEPLNRKEAQIKKKGPKNSPTPRKGANHGCEREGGGAGVARRWARTRAIRLSGSGDGGFSQARVLGVR